MQPIQNISPYYSLIAGLGIAWNLLINLSTYFKVEFPYQSELLTVLAVVLVILFILSLRYIKRKPPMLTNNRVNNRYLIAQQQRQDASAKRRFIFFAFFIYAGLCSSLFDNDYLDFYTVSNDLTHYYLSSAGEIMHTLSKNEFVLYQKSLARVFSGWQMLGYALIFICVFRKPIP